MHCLCPIEIPFIKDTISSYLTIPEIAFCTRVCSSWYLAFGAVLYKNVSFNSQRILAHFGSQHGQRGLSRNAECVQFIRSEFCYVFQALPEVPFCNLRKLSTLASEYPNKGIVDVTNARRILTFVSLNQSLQEICLRNFPWMCETTALQLKETLHAHPRLKIVSLSSFREASLGNLIHVLRGITNLEKLSLVCRSAISWEEGSTLAEILADNATEFSLLDAGTVCQLKELEMSADLSQIAQVTLFPLLRHCQHLERLHIPNVNIDNGPQFNELCRLVRISCPQLKHLASDCHRGTDISQASLLESCRNLRSYKQLQPQPLGSLSVSALLSLDRHSTTLEFLDISQCSGIDSKDLQLILTSCPNLQIFEALPSTNSSFRFEPRLNVQDMFTPVRVTSLSTTPVAKSSVASSRPGPWACHRLRVIKLGFSGFSEFATAQEVAPYTDAVYHQLSLLTELEELHLAGECMIAPSTIGGQQQPHTQQHGQHQDERQRWAFSFSLNSGLWKLGKLKKLHTVNVCRILHHQIRADEARWMVEHWPRLTRFCGPVGRAAFAPASSMAPGYGAAQPTSSTSAPVHDLVPLSHLQSSFVGSNEPISGHTPGAFPNYNDISKDFVAEFFRCKPALHVTISPC
ncbi:hypothetical protein BGZ82_000958 [Podila clonocystis]|nr:hypothetical protein BGZ82_000958 [Podila clonocystis]